MMMDFFREAYWKAFAPRVPRTELCRFKNIDFFPAECPDFTRLRSICIGSKTRSIGDPLLLSSLPSRLKARYPHLKIYTYPRGFNPIVFAGNPHVSGVQWLPDVLYGDDCNLGTGHLIARKERFFGVDPQTNSRPEIHLLDKEKQWAKQLYEQSRASQSELPVCVFHPWGSSHASVLSEEVWNRLIAKYSGHARFWQVGVEGQKQIEGCERYFLLPKSFMNARKLFAILSRAELFFGVDSGPMHVARAFGVPSFIMTDYGMSADVIFAERDRTEGAADSKWHRFFLYQGNQHFDVIGKSESEAMLAADGFFSGRR